MKQFGLALVSLLLVAGCASVRPHVVTRPSDRPAGALGAGGARDLPSSIGETHAADHDARPSRSPLPTVEARYPELTDAIGRASAAPTALNLVLAGEAYRRAGILDRASDYYTRATRLAPASAAAWDGLARTWRDWGFPELALPHASRAVFFAPDSAAAHNTLGTILHALGQAWEARSEFTQAFVLDPKAAYALNNLCYSWVSAGRGTLAGDACRQALALAPDLGPARNNLALVFALQGDIKAAQREFARTSDPAATDYNLGIVYLAQRKFGEAAAAFARAASVAPGLPLVLERADLARRLAAAAPASEGNHERR